MNLYEVKNHMKIPKFKIEDMSKLLINSINY